MRRFPFPLYISHQSEKEGLDERFSLFSDNHTAAGLVGGKDEHLGNLYVGRGIGSIDGHVGYVVASQWLDALVDTRCTVGIAMKADIAEVRFHKSGL